MELGKKRHQQGESAMASGRGKSRRVGEERQLVIGRKNAEVHKGVFDTVHSTFGFIEESEGRRVFVMPSSCKEWDKFPPIGAVVTFNIVRDVKTNKDRADNVRGVSDEETAERWRAKKLRKAEGQHQQGAEGTGTQEKQEHRDKAVKQARVQSFAKGKSERLAERGVQEKGSGASRSSDQAGDAAVEISDDDEKAKQDCETWPMTMSVVERVAERMELPAKTIEAVNKALGQAKAEFARSYQACKEIEKAEERAEALEEVVKLRGTSQRGEGKGLFSETEVSCRR